MKNLNEEQKKCVEYMSLEGEVWVQHPDFPDYRISNHGRVVSLKHYPYLIKVSEGRGCLRATLIDKDGRTKTRSVLKLFKEGV